MASSILLLMYESIALPFSFVGIEGDSLSTLISEREIISGCPNLKQACSKESTLIGLRFIFRVLTVFFKTLISPKIIG